MTTIAWLLVGMAIVILALIAGCLIALLALTRDDWQPDKDGFSDEEDA